MSRAFLPSCSCCGGVRTLFGAGVHGAASALCGLCDTPDDLTQGQLDGLPGNLRAALLGWTRRRGRALES